LRHIVLIGKKGSGKSLQEKLISEHYYDIIKVVSHTTRPKRKGEINHVDYHYVSDGQFELMVSNDEFAEVVHNRGASYGISRQELEGSSDKVFVVDYDGLKQLRDAGYNPFVVYMCCDYTIRKDRITNRDGYFDSKVFDDDNEYFDNTRDNIDENLFIDSGKFTQEEINKVIMNEYMLSVKSHYPNQGNKLQQNLGLLNDIKKGNKYKLTIKPESGISDLFIEFKPCIVEILDEHRTFYSVKALPDKNIVTPIVFSINKHNIISKLVKLKEMN